MRLSEVGHILGEAAQPKRAEIGADGSDARTRRRREGDGRRVPARHGPARALRNPVEGRPAHTPDVPSTVSL